MFLEFLYPLVKYFTPLNVFRYLTFRAAYGALTALFISFLFGPRIIEALRTLKVGQAIRDDGPQSHLKKGGTPTMGGVLIILSVLVAVLLWQDLHNFYVWLTLAGFVGFGAIGFVDDYLKVTQKNSKGLPAWAKLVGQFGVAFVIVLTLYYSEDAHITQLYIPFFKNPVINLGWVWIPFAVVLLVWESNAVNLTDGLDGLAIGLVILVFIALSILTYLSGRADYAAYLGIPYIPGAGELTIFCLAIVGASVGFLWFNAHPAEVFMGDVGSLSLGGVMADAVAKAAGLPAAAVRRAAMLGRQVHEELGVVAHGQDLLRIADDAGVPEVGVELVVGHGRVDPGLEAVKRRLEARPFVVDDLPVEPGLEYAAGHLAEPAVVRGGGELRPAPGTMLGDQSLQRRLAALPLRRLGVDLREFPHGRLPANLAPRLAKMAHDRLAPLAERLGIQKEDPKDREQPLFPGLFHHAAVGADDPRGFGVLRQEAQARRIGFEPFHQVHVDEDAVPFGGKGGHGLGDVAQGRPQEEDAPGTLQLLGTAQVLRSADGADNGMLGKALPQNSVGI